MTDQERIAQFLASKSVTVIACGVSNGMTAREWKHAVRGDYLTAKILMSEEASDALRANAHDAFVMRDTEEGYRLLALSL